jgi:hypothetical protein
VRNVATVATVLAVGFGAAACNGNDGGRSTPTTSEGANVHVDGEFAARQREYLEFATATLAPGSPLSVLAHFERAARDDTFTFDPAAVTPAAFADTFAEIDGFDDTTDFDLLYFLNLLYAYGTELPNETRAAIEQRLTTFKYWFTEPTPEGIVDDKYYWSENHRIIFHTDEYLAGSLLPDAVFTNDGRTGAQHAATAKQRILDWLDEKVRFGFSEWHSDVYYQKDVTPLLTLVEFAPDETVAHRAAMVLDLVLLDLALHLHRGNFGATHGRSYMKDKSTALDQDVFGLAKLAFDDTTEPYQSATDAGATLLARAKKYAVPAAIRAIARSDEPLVDRERMNVPIDPSAPVTDDPAPPYGISYDDPDNVAFWWERGAQTAWQVVPLTIRTLDRHDLWESQFYAPFKPLRDLVGDDMGQARRLAQSLAPVLAFGLLSEVHTYTYRTPSVMLSTAQDYRPGVFSEQIHSWQATLDEHALVFTTQPKNEPQTGTQWPDSDGYWTGTGSTPRSAQHGAAAIHIYSPQYEPFGPPLDVFSYLDSTHAYFPQERFDEVEQDGNWTFGRKGDGYVALWSQRPARWRAAGPDEFTHGLEQPFDLVAPGRTNVWIVEVGDATRWRTFDAFRAAITAAAVRVTGTLDVTYASPTEGAMTFGWSAPFTVGGAEVDLHPPERMHNRYVTVPFEGRTYEIRVDDASLTLDFDAWTRRA